MMTSRPRMMTCRSLRFRVQHHLSPEVCAVAAGDVRPAVGVRPSLHEHAEPRTTPVHHRPLKALRGQPAPPAAGLDEGATVSRPAPVPVPVPAPCLRHRPLKALCGQPAPPAAGLDEGATVSHPAPCLRHRPLKALRGQPASSAAGLDEGATVSRPAPAPCLRHRPLHG